jgi:hypothetical protein
VASTNYDLIVGGTSVKVLRGEGQGYRRRTIRKEVAYNLLGQSNTSAFTSRDDRPSLYQSSWAGGSRWWKPLITPEETDSYFRSNHMDVWSEAGKIVPSNQVTDAANTNLADDCVIMSNLTDVFAIGETNVTNAAFRDLYKWAPASNAFTRVTTHHSGIVIADQPVSGVYDSSDSLFYVLSQDASTGGRQISRFASGGSTTADWFTNSSALLYGSAIMVTPFGLVYSGGGAFFLIDKAGPTQTSIGAAAAEVLSLPGTSTLFRTEEMSVTTPEGIYFVRNQFSDGQFQAWVYRLERDATGSWILNPLAPLPTGSMALSIAYHLGSVIIAASPEPQTIIDQTEHAEVILYQYTNNQPGTLGSLLGRGNVDETPYGMLGTNGPLLYIGGHKRLWVYDAVRGGIHTAWEWGTLNTLGPYKAMAWTRDSADEGIVIFVGPDRIARTKRSLEDDPDTVAAFGDDESFYTLESNFFDGGLPLEPKELTKVAILREKGDGDQEWTVQLAADEGNFSDALVHSTTGEVYAEADLNGTTGRSFRYKVIYQTKDTQRNALKAIYVSQTTGEMTIEWDLFLDGSQLLNVDNAPQDEETFYDAMVTLAATQTSTTLIDNYQEQGQETSTTATATRVKVMLVEIIKEKPGESMVHLVLRET